MTRSCCSPLAASQDEKLIAALRPLLGAIPVALMRAANARACKRQHLGR